MQHRNKLSHHNALLFVNAKQAIHFALMTPLHILFQYSSHLVWAAPWYEDSLVLVLLKVPGLHASVLQAGSQVGLGQHEAVVKDDVTHLQARSGWGTCRAGRCRARVSGVPGWL